MKPWKIQKFFGDIVYDLRSRGLLPVAVLLLVGMIAVPLLISRSGSDTGGGPPVSASAAELAPENQAAVLAYNPGVRNYKQRLDALASKDPFEQKFSAPAVGTTSLEQSGTGLEGSGDTGTGGGSDTGDVPTGGSTGKPKIRYFYYVTDVEVGEADGEMKKKKAVDPFDYLPGESAPVLVFLGNQPDKSAVFLISKDVLSVEGAGSCFPSPEACQLLALKTGENADLVYGIDSKTYRIKVTSVKLRVSRKLPKR